MKKSNNWNNFNNNFNLNWSTEIIIINHQQQQKTRRHHYYQIIIITIIKKVKGIIIVFLIIKYCTIPLFIIEKIIEIINYDCAIIIWLFIISI